MKRGGADEEMGRGRRVNDKREEEREEQGGQRRGEERKIVSGKKKKRLLPRAINPFFTASSVAPC